MLVYFIKRWKKKEYWASENFQKPLLDSLQNQIRPFPKAFPHFQVSYQPVKFTLHSTAGAALTTGATCAALHFLSTHTPNHIHKAHDTQECTSGLPPPFLYLNTEMKARESSCQNALLLCSPAKEDDLFVLLSITVQHFPAHQCCVPARLLAPRLLRRRSSGSNTTAETS